MRTRLALNVSYANVLRTSVVNNIPVCRSQWNLHHARETQQQPTTLWRWKLFIFFPSQSKGDRKKLLAAHENSIIEIFCCTFTCKTVHFYTVDIVDSTIRESVSLKSLLLFCTSIKCQRLHRGWEKSVFTSDPYRIVKWRMEKKAVQIFCSKMQMLKMKTISQKKVSR